MIKTFISNININQSSKPKSLSNLFPLKSIVEKIFLFLSPKTKFHLLKYSKSLLEEYDIKIDDYFIPRKYQEKIKNYNNNYEDLFYKILYDIKKEKENNGEKVVLYEIENSMIKYLKYLTMKYNKIITISLININMMEIWKLEFISKLLGILEKNVHIKLNLNYLDLKTNDIFSFICRFSKAINILEIDDVFTNKSQFTNLNEEIKTWFNWNTINKIIINMNDYAQVEQSEGYEKKRSETFLIHILNVATIPNLIDFDLRCDFMNFHDITKFLKNNGKNITKLNIDNSKLNNEVEIENNSLLRYLVKITELSMTIEEKQLEKLLYFFYPIFPKIQKFHLIINENENSDDNDDVKLNENIKRKNDKKNNKTIYNKKNKTKRLHERKIENGQYKFSLNQLNFVSEIPSFETENYEISDDESEHFSRNKNNYKKKVGEKPLNSFISTLSNLNNCESLTYEIKTNNIYSNNNTKINSLSYLINCLEGNKDHLKYLEIYINNDESTPINIDDFTLLIEKISDCYNLNIFIFECELYNEYASIFSTYFNTGNNLTHLSLVHTTDLEIMKIINRHINLTHIKFDLISKKSKLSKNVYKEYSYDLDLNRNWKSIDLTNYPINKSLINLLKYNKNIYTSLNLCNNVSDVDEIYFNEIIKNTSNDNSTNKW